MRGDNAVRWRRLARMTKYGDVQRLISSIKPVSLVDVQQVASIGPALGPVDAADQLDTMTLDGGDLTWTGEEVGGYSDLGHVFGVGAVDLVLQLLLSSDIVAGATLTGARVQLGVNGVGTGVPGISSYDGSGNQLWSVNANTGLMTFKTAASGARVEIDSAGVRGYSAAAQLFDLASASGLMTFKTAASGARVEIDSAGIRGYSAAAQLFGLASATGLMFFKSATSGARVEIDSTGVKGYTAGAENIRLDPADGILKCFGTTYDIRISEQEIAWYDHVGAGARLCGIRYDGTWGLYLDSGTLGTTSLAGWNFTYDLFVGAVKGAARSGVVAQYNKDWTTLLGAAPSGRYIKFTSTITNAGGATWAIYGRRADTGASVALVTGITTTQTDDVGLANSYDAFCLSPTSGDSNASTNVSLGWESGVLEVQGRVGIKVSPARYDLHVNGDIGCLGIFTFSDLGGIAGSLGLTNVFSGVSTGHGTVHMDGATARDSVGWVKAYNGTTAIYIPYWTTITG